MRELLDYFMVWFIPVVDKRVGQVKLCYPLLIIGAIPERLRDEQLMVKRCTNKASFTFHLFKQKFAKTQADSRSCKIYLINRGGAGNFWLRGPRSGGLWDRSPPSPSGAHGRRPGEGLGDEEAETFFFKK